MGAALNHESGRWSIARGHGRIEPVLCPRSRAAFRRIEIAARDVERPLYELSKLPVRGRIVGIALWVSVFTLSVFAGIVMVLGISLLR